MAGVRIQLTNTLRLDLGGRVNQRWLETSAHDDQTSSFVDADQVGSLDRFKEYYAGGKLAVALDQRTELFTEVYATHIINTATDEDGDRLRVGAGMKIGF